MTPCDYSSVLAVPASERLRRASEALVTKIDAMLADDQFKGVFMIAHVHGYNYSGPQIGDELEALRAAVLAEDSGQVQTSANRKGE